MIGVTKESRRACVSCAAGRKTIEATCFWDASWHLHSDVYKNFDNDEERDTGECWGYLPEEYYLANVDLNHLSSSPREPVPTVVCPAPDGALLLRKADIAYVCSSGINFPIQKLSFNIH
ncbi:hypothetical protein PMIN02_000621 [Paraphaeosphaeria minitans]